MSKQPVVFSPLANTYGGGIYGLNRNIASIWCVKLSHRIWLGKENKGVSLAMPLCSDSRKACNNFSIINRFNTHRSPAVYRKDTSDVLELRFDALQTAFTFSLHLQSDTISNPRSSICYFRFLCCKSGHCETKNLQKKRPRRFKEEDERWWLTVSTSATDILVPRVRRFLFTWSWNEGWWQIKPSGSGDENGKRSK